MDNPSLVSESNCYKYLKAKSLKFAGNKITVDRGRDNTKAEKHVAGAEVKGIDYTETTTPTFGPIGTDSALIEEGDNFGFDGGFI